MEFEYDNIIDDGHKLYTNILHYINQTVLSESYKIYLFAFYFKKDKNYNDYINETDKYNIIYNNENYIYDFAFTFDIKGQYHSMDCYLLSNEYYEYKKPYLTLKNRNNSKLNKNIFINEEN